MSASAISAGRRQAPALLSIGFRPFFLAAAGWSVIALVLWVCSLVHGLVLPSRFDPLDWHIHEMLFGFVMAAVAGFLLTAIPNWTGRAPVSGGTLGALVLFWAAGRVACLTSVALPAWFATTVDLSFPVALLAVTAHEVFAARNWRNVPILVPVAVFTVANLLMHLESAGIVLSPGLGWRMGVMAAIVLISAIGGRIVPAFTRNWLVARGQTVPAPARGMVDRLAMAVLHTGLLGWVAFPDSRIVGGLLLAGGALNLWRLARWRGAAALPEPLLFILHVGYAWLVLGVLLLGLSLLWPALPVIAAIHALTAGAIGTMILAVMTRVSLGHTGRALTAGPATVAIYALVTLAALARMAAVWSGGAAMPVLIASALFWVGAFGLFVASYGRMLVVPRGR